ncbi:hypothetical protein GCM10009789_28490 [Kribbella sancticallisti]|uniref:Uncharacterized protein n=1 Tax=Kribbella sancticallisti TaxID=460087 RepID=A0ABN2D9R1_9ACTN
MHHLPDTRRSARVKDPLRPTDTDGLKVTHLMRGLECPGQMHLRVRATDNLS